MPIAAGLYYFEHSRDAVAPNPIVLIHGAGGNHLYWPPEIRRMKGQHIFALDLPGHGKSGGPGEQSIQGYSDALLRWMDILGLQIITLVGHSMGGAVTMTFASQHRDRIAAMGLISTGARLKVDPSLMEHTASSGTFASAVEMMIGRSFSESADPRLVGLAMRRFKETRPSVLHGDFVACDAFDIRETMFTLTAPTLVVCGDQDRMTPLRFSQHLARHLPDARLDLVPDAGHMVILERPRLVAASLLAFLNELD